MIISYILPSIFHSGGTTSVYEYCNHLSKLGHRVCLYYPIFPLDGYRGTISLKRFLYYIHLVKEHFKNIIKNKIPKHNFEIKIVPLLNNFFIGNADFVVATTWHTTYVVRKLKKRKGKRIYFIQGYENWDSNKSLVDGSYLLGLDSISISKNLQDFLFAEFNLKTKLIYNGFAKQNYYFDNHKKDFALRNILFIDYGASQKNTIKLISELNNIKLKYPHINIFSFGFQNYSPKPDYIEFYSNPDQNQIRNLYNNADLFVFPSLQEGFGNPPVEAMACNCAVASTSVGGVPEYIVHNKTGFILNNDLSNLSEIVDNLVKDRNKLRVVSQNGRESINKFLGWERPVNQFLNFLKSLQ